MGSFRSGEIYRYPYERDSSKAFVDGLPSFFHITANKDNALVLLEKGISQIAPPKKRKTEFSYPAIVISSSPHSRGSEWNPWHDNFEPDLGYVRYFGDAKKPGNPSEAPGNKLLLAELGRHTSGDLAVRSNSSPLVFFERVKVEDRTHGNLKFHGFGVIERAELVTQFNPGLGYFTNYVFTFAVLSLSDEDEEFSWDWINSRRSSEVGSQESLSLAPVSWQKWIKHGHTNFYSKAGKHRFELLASRVVMSHVNSYAGGYSEGWVTRGSGDGGVDFVGKVRLGQGLAAVDVVVLGQAKCESPDTPTSGVALARTVARLKRGWIGAYVTTSFFSKQSQIEVIEDSYPLIKISGKTLAEETLKLVEAGGFRDTLGYLESLEVEYPEMIQNRRPDEILEL